ncbi:MAG: ribbon-helix-helix protein, CopG family [Myxococcales bacterium]|nr:ribbon-helix-helix protein, CopG family [Myxococcales bacterium]
MSRLTISLPEPLAAILARESERRATSVSDVVRRALASYLGLTDEAPRKLPFAGLGRSGRRHTARNAEEILAREWRPNARRR